MIDHGFIFDGPHWRLHDSPVQGLYFQPEVYHEATGLDDFQPWLDRIAHFPEAVVDQALSQIPSAWLAGDEDGLTRLLELAMRRRKRVADLLARCGNPHKKVFPKWD